METNYIALAIPVFFLMIFAEIAYEIRSRRFTYRFNDAFTDLGCGVSSQVVAAFTHASVVAVYAYAHNHWALFQFPKGDPWPWIIALFGVDLGYYWWHRKSHEINFLWAAHVVHHQSEDYNLAVALRQELLSGIPSLFFYLPLAFLGIDPVIFAASVSFNTLYQFWIHTQHVPKLGPLEWVLNTPSHHRVHHGINPIYLDRNHAGIFIIWDRLFGTFQPETETPVYGITKPLRSFNPLWANMHYWADILAWAKAAPDWQGAIQVFIKGPEWKPPWLPPDASPAPPRTPQAQVKYNPDAPAKLKPYIVAHFIVTALALVLLLHRSAQGIGLAEILLATGVLLAVAVFGGIFEHKPWVRGAEFIRLAVMAGAAALIFEAAWVQTAALVAAGAFALWFATVGPLLRTTEADLATAPEPRPAP